jgi:uncharacterized protein YbjT (DUF2867 family)
MTVLVIGPTGTVGSQLLPLLAEQRTPVRALVHANGAASRLSGVEVATGDLTDPSTLVQAMTGVQRVYLLTPPAPADLHVQMERNALDAAVKTGVAHVVKQSVHLAAPDAPVGIMRSHFRCEELLRASGLPFTILRPNSFMQNLLTFAPAIRATGVFAAPAQGVRLSLIDARDVAAAAAAALTQPGHEGATYQLTGPEALGFAELASQLTRAVRAPIAYAELPIAELPVAQARARMRATGMPEFLLEEAIAHFDYWRTGVGAEVTSHLGDLIGRPPRRFAAFAHDHADAFRRPAPDRPGTAAPPVPPTP